MLPILLFVFYTLLICFFIRKAKQFAHTAVSRNIFVAVFLFRLLAGVVYAYIYSLPPYNLHSDTWSVFQSSLREYNLLLHRPLEFLRTTFIFEGDISYTNFTQGQSSYWNILKEVLLVKFEAVLNLFSFGNYYVNLVLYSFLMLLGSNVFFRTLENIYKYRSYLNLALAFLVPSTVFWTSAIYKDGLLFVLMAITCFQTMRWLDGRRGLVPYIIILLASMAGLFLLRTYVALVMAPAILGWILSEKLRLRPVAIFLAIYCFGLLAAVLLKHLHPSFDIPGLMASWQAAFLETPANSALAAKPLEPGFSGLLTNLPQSLNFAFLRPLLWENKGKQYILFALELFVMQLLFIFSIFQRSSASRRQSAFRLFCFCVAFTGCLFLGYTVHIIGALVRYRSIFWPFMLVALCGIRLSATRRKIVG